MSYWSTSFWSTYLSEDILLEGLVSPVHLFSWSLNVSFLLILLFFVGNFFLPTTMSLTENIKS